MAPQTAAIPVTQGRLVDSSPDSSPVLPDLGLHISGSDTTKLRFCSSPCTVCASVKCTSWVCIYYLATVAFWCDQIGPGWR